MEKVLMDVCTGTYGFLGDLGVIILIPYDN